MKVLIVGGVAGGATFAARLRRLSEKAEIIMFEKGEYISFANCGLPYYIGDVITNRDRLLVQTEENMTKRFNLDIRTNSEVIKIDRENKKVIVKNKDSEYEETYDYLLLSPGAKPLIPNISGIENNPIFSLRNMSDVDKIKKFIEDEKPYRIAIIGAGFIGIELAENFKELGRDVTIIELSNQVMPNIDYEMANIVKKELHDKGIKIMLGEKVKSFSKVEVIDAEDDSLNQLEIGLDSGLKLDVDMAIIAAGVTPDTAFAKEAGIKVGERGHIIVDETLKTSDPSIYAVGDAILVDNLISKTETYIPLAGIANKQARIAADNILGRNTKFTGAIGTSILKVFDYAVAAAGLNEKTLIDKNIKFEKIYIGANSHAGYYPGAQELMIKLLFNPDNGKILGAQIIGKDGADKRIDIIATAIKHDLTVFDLEELELAYAPPYGSAKDPINMIGYVASNVVKGDMKTYHFEEIKNITNETLLDVRTDLEYDNGNIKGSVNIPVDELRDRLNELDKTKKIIVYCKSGLRAYLASRILTENGYDVYNMSGGYEFYKFYENIFSLSLPLDENQTKIEEQVVHVEEENKKALIIKVDACGLQCPGPIMEVFKAIGTINEGDILEVHATDSAFSADIKAWCKRTNNTLLNIEQTKDEYIVHIKKGMSAASETNNEITSNSHNKTIVVFSGDLDKALASFIIANGAAAMGRKVTLFFTFWGLNILRSDNKVKVSKNIMEKMFALMMPRGSKKLSLSKMNMGGAGTKMMKMIMKQKGVSSLEELIESAKTNNVKIVACAMSMDIMGIKKEELIEGIEIGGVGYYLGEAEDADTNLFI